MVEMRKVKGGNNPHGALPLFIGEGDHVSGDGVPKTLRTVKLRTSHSSLALHPLTTYVVPSPYKQGESAVRNAKNRVNLSNLLVYSYLKNLFTITTPQ